MKVEFLPPILTLLLRVSGYSLWFSILVLFFHNIHKGFPAPAFTAE